MAVQVGNVVGQQGAVAVGQHETVEHFAEKRCGLVQRNAGVAGRWGEVGQIGGFLFKH